MENFHLNESTYYNLFLSVLHVAYCIVEPLSRSSWFVLVLF